jgi:hypothetical protein
MWAERGACVRRRSWAGYTINRFEFEFPTGIGIAPVGTCRTPIEARREAEARTTPHSGPLLGKPQLGWLLGGRLIEGAGERPGGVTGRSSPPSATKRRYLAMSIGAGNQDVLRPFRPLSSRCCSIRPMSCCCWRRDAGATEENIPCDALLAQP